MEELLKKILERKRSERSSSEESSTSPEAKKARSEEVNSPEEVEEHKVEDEIFTVLKMAEGFHKALEEINRKLEKLDAIQTTVMMSKRPFKNWKEEYRSWNIRKQPPATTLRT